MSICGTPPYVAPDILAASIYDEPYGPKASCASPFVLSLSSCPCLLFFGDLWGLLSRAIVGGNKDRFWRF